jgi:coproporphyrinogen III oxidase-like Fe-S oxidoreductase
MTATPQTSRALELLLKHDRPVPRYTSYPTAAAFRADVGDLQLRQQLAEITDAPLSLYVHVPFCRHACWYCGCNRITTQLGSKVVEPYLASLAQELELIAEAMPQRRRLAQMHWGGGTPNYLNREETAQLWELIREVMCQFEVQLPPTGFEQELADFKRLECDGLVGVSQGADGSITVRVTTAGRWLIRTIAAVLDPNQRHQASGSRLI